MERNYGNILIREATINDAEQLCSWWNEGRIMEHAGFPKGLGISTETVKRQIEDDDSKSRHMILYNNIPIGEMNYREIEGGICEIGIKICDFSMQNKGLGKIILSLFIDVLINEHGYHKIVLDTNLNNKRAQHVYEQLGFKKVRINENAWKNQIGIWQSFVDYELEKDEFASYLRDKQSNSYF